MNLILISSFASNIYSWSPNSILASLFCLESDCDLNHIQNSSPDIETWKAWKTMDKQEILLKLLEEIFIILNE
jgi:hypothetical protein